MIHINLIGYDYSHNPGFCIRRPKGLPYYTFIVFRSKANINVAGKNIVIDSPAVFIYKKYHSQYYSCYAGEVFVNDWFCFSCGERDVEVTLTGYDETNELLKTLDIPVHT